MSPSRRRHASHVYMLTRVLPCASPLFTCFFGWAFFFLIECIFCLKIKRLKTFFEPDSCFLIFLFLLLRILVPPRKLGAIALKLKMALSVDEVLEKIGSMGLYQIRLIIILSYIEMINLTYQVMLPSLISAEPKWMCAGNNSHCNISGQFDATDERRCKMPRESWKFADDFTSVVTTVIQLTQM